MFKGEQDSRMKSMIKKGKSMLNDIKDQRVIKVDGEFSHYLEEYRPNMTPFYK